jgi:SOS-response transcriptional repressor LexA
MQEDRRFIPIAPATEKGSDPFSADAHSACSGAESFALMVLGDSMRPEFEEGEVIVIEPEGLATDGAFVLAHAGGEWIFRQLVAVGEAWELRALAPGYPAIPIPDLAPVRGVVIQKSRPGRRRATKRYAP